MPLSEASLAVWLFAFARLAGWTVFDPLTGRLPRLLRLLIAAVLAAVLAPGLSKAAVDPFSVQGMLAMSLEAVWGAALALCVWLVFAAMAAARAANPLLALPEPSGSQSHPVMFPHGGRQPGLGNQGHSKRMRIVEEKRVDGTPFYPRPMGE